MPRIMRHAMPGMSRLAMGLMGGAYGSGYDNELTAQSKLAQAMAAAQASEAHARAFDADAALKRQKFDVAGRRPELLEEQAALASGSDIPMVRALREGLRTGRAPVMQTMGPPDESGGLGGAAMDPAVQSKIGQALQRYLVPLMSGTDDITAQDWAKAQGAYRGQDLGDDVLAGRRTAADVGRSQAAIEGKPLTQAHEYGIADLFGGRIDDTNPVARRFSDYRTATTGAQKANTEQSYASADASRASAAKTRAETADGTNTKGQKAPTGYRWTAAGELEPIKGGPADPATKGAKLAKPPTESQGKALAFASRMQVSDEILNDLAEEGVDQPGRIKQLAESLPIIGTGAGMAANATASPKQQQVEQAQRNFINAVLRRESGAVISPDEFKNAERQYFPQPNDDPATKRQKAINRRVATEAMKAEFGEQFIPDFDRITGEARQARQKDSPQKVSGKVTGGFKYLGTE